MNKIKIIDNFLSLKNHKEILNTLTSNCFEWYIQENNLTVDKKIYLKNKNIYKNIIESFQMCHGFYNQEKNINSNKFYLIENFIKKFALKNKTNKIQIIRAKANILFKQNRLLTQHNTPHVDFNQKHKVLLYYVNDSDGDTLFFKNKKIIKRVSPKSNRLIIFDGDILHAGSNPLKSDYRIVLNINCYW